VILEEDTVDLSTPTGPMRTYLYRPVRKAAAPRTHAGIVLFSEIFQRTGPIGRMAAMLAGHGFVVAVPEIFHELEASGTVLAYDQAGADAGNAHKTAKTVAAYDADARAVVDHLLAMPTCNGTIGAMGVCIGGHLSFRCALDRRVRAAACFYATDLHKGSLGQGGDDSLARAGEIEAELLMIWGRQDPHIPDEGRRKIHSRLTETGRAFTWHEVNAAHAFMRDEGPRYDPELALFGYRSAVDLFRRM
jgi:carboxymethylenebutenolidase